MGGQTSDFKDLEIEIAHLRGLDLKGLRARWKGVFRREALPHVPRHLLFAVLAYRLQADRLGDLEPAVRKVLDEVGRSESQAVIVDRLAERDLQRAPLAPGTVLMRQWNGRDHRVMVMEGGFGWNGRIYDSLSQVALAITGTRWNGPRFFGLRDKRAAEGSCGVRP
jgi:Protein of unknown function (DUF2924)